MNAAIRALADSAVTQHSFWLFDTEANARSAEATITTLRNLPDAPAVFVSVDVCELRRIPNTTDVMATYVIQLDEGGGLLGYKRTRRYTRGTAEGGE